MSPDDQTTEVIHIRLFFTNPAGRLQLDVYGVYLPPIGTAAGDVRKQNFNADLFFSSIAAARDDILNENAAHNIFRIPKAHISYLRQLLLTHPKID